MKIGIKGVVGDFSLERWDVRQEGASRNKEKLYKAEYFTLILIMVLIERSNF